MLRFCANISMMFVEVPLAQRFAAAHAAGFPGVEIQWPYDMPAASFATAAREAGIEVVNFNAPRGTSGAVGTAGLPGREEEFRAGIAAARDYAEAIGCRQVNILAGLLPQGGDRAACLDVLARNLEYAAQEFGRAGIGTLTEPINARDRPGYLLNTVADAAALLRRIGHPNLRIEADIYHMGQMGEDIAGTFRRNAALIGHVQFADVPGRAEPGTGALPFAEIFPVLEEIGYAGWVSAEYNPSRRTEETLAWYGRWR